jgi:hypothetical protein
VCLFAHIRNQPFFAAEMLVILVNFPRMFTIAYHVASELDDGNDHNQANNDTDNRSNDSGLVPGFAGIEISKLFTS